MSNPVKYVQKNAQSFAMFSALAKYAQNMSILCPNFGHYLDTFSLIFLSWKCPKFWAYFGHQKSRLKNMCKLHKSVQNMSIICPNFGHIMDTYIQPPVLQKHRCSSTMGGWTHFGHISPKIVQLYVQSVSIFSNMSKICPKYVQSC